ncbi:MAG TPA: hypothetical protein VII08_11835 [Myxococcales bacterium]
MLHTPRLSLVPLGAEHFEPLAAMYADAEIIRFSRTCAAGSR